MTIFSDNPHDRRIERFMTAIPNFKPRGVGVRFSESQVLITITAATPTEILAETMRQIRCPPFRKRFNEYTNSTNHTYVDGKMIQPNTEVPIQQGTKIRLGNEDFEFKLR